MCPDAATAAQADVGAIERLIYPLGLATKRAAMVVRFSAEYMGTEVCTVLGMNGGRPSNGVAGVLRGAACCASYSQTVGISSDGMVPFALQLVAQMVACQRHACLPSQSHWPYGLPAYSGRQAQHTSHAIVSRAEPPWLRQPLPCQTAQPSSSHADSSQSVQPQMEPT